MDIKDFLVLPDSDPGPSTCMSPVDFPAQSAAPDVLSIALHLEYESEPDTCYEATITNVDCGDRTLWVGMYDFDTKTYDRKVNLYGSSGFLPADTSVTFTFVTKASVTDDTSMGGYYITPYVGEAYYGAQPTSCQYKIKVVNKATGDCVDYIEH